MSESIHEETAPAPPVTVIHPPSPSNERATLVALLDSPDPIDKIFPDQVGAIDIDDFHRKFDVVCRGFCTLRAYNNKVKVLLGRALYCIQMRPILYKEKGFRTFDNFLADATARFGISRSEMYATISLAKAFGDMTPAACAAIGTSKLYLASKVLNADARGTVERDELLAKARLLSVKDFATHLEEKIHLSAGDSTVGMIVVHTTLNNKKAWELFSTNPRVQSYCGTDKPGGILMYMIEECMGEWLAKAEEAANAET